MSTSAFAPYTAITVPTQFVEANGICFAYRRWGKETNTLHSGSKRRMKYSPPTSHSS